MEAGTALLHDILGFRGNETGRYYIGVVVGVHYATDPYERSVEVRFWMPKAKQLDKRSIRLSSFEGVDLIGGLPKWAEWDDDGIQE